MMLTQTVPDKLGVMSFVYQMYQFFNRATISAIHRSLSPAESLVGEAAQKPSPIDLSVFNQFTFDRLSPVSSPPATSLTGERLVNQYSRNLSKSRAEEGEGEGERGEEEEEGGRSMDASSFHLSPIQGASQKASRSDTSNPTNLHSTPKSAANSLTGNAKSSSPGPAHRKSKEHSPGSARKSKENSPGPARSRSKSSPGPAHRKLSGNQPPVEGTCTPAVAANVSDRDLEYENVTVSEDTEPSTTSLDVQAKEEESGKRRRGSEGEGGEGRRGSEGEGGEGRRGSEGGGGERRRGSEGGGGEGRRGSGGGEGRRGSEGGGGEGRRGSEGGGGEGRRGSGEGGSEGRRGSNERERVRRASDGDGKTLSQRRQDSETPEVCFDHSMHTYMYMYM